MAYNGSYSIALRILLLKQHLEVNIGRNRYVSPQDIHDYLKEYEIDVEKKARYADFAALGDVFGSPLEYAFRQNVRLGMRSNFFKKKEKTLENHWPSRVWWRQQDSNL